MFKLASDPAGMLRRAVGRRLRDVVGRPSSREAHELARRERQRSSDGNHWFTSNERALADVLASLIVPSDDTSPGAEDAEVTSALDRLVASSPWRQALYARGLLSFDDWSQREHGCVFIALPRLQQMELLKAADRLYRGQVGKHLILRFLGPKLVRLYCLWRFPAIDFFPQLVDDVFQTFYTSWVSWVWLGYDGPPMPDGYPDLLPRRPYTANDG